MFVPGSNKPDDLDKAMRASLADSVDYIASSLSQKLDVSPAEARSLVDSIRSHRVTPAVFGRYYKLVLAVQSGSYDAARSLFVEMIGAAATTPAFHVALYSSESLGAEAQLYGDVIDPDPGPSPWLCPPSSAAGFEQRVRDSLDLIAIADPILADELRGLIVQVVGAAPSHGPAARPFGSVSSFMLWGLLIVNLERYRTAADLIQGLVHEAAHLLLFAHSIEGPLVTNAIEERYTSPLRSDPRPMDGVFHATFVTARVHFVNRKLREAASATFEPVPVKELDRRLVDLRGLYFGGLKTVMDHAKLTTSGRRVLEESLDYMNSV